MIPLALLEENWCRNVKAVSLVSCPVCRQTKHSLRHLEIHIGIWHPNYSHTPLLNSQDYPLALQTETLAALTYRP